MGPNEKHDDEVSGWIASDVIKSATSPDVSEKMICHGIEDRDRNKKEDQSQKGKAKRFNPA